MNQYIDNNSINDLFDHARKNLESNQIIMIPFNPDNIGIGYLGNGNVVWDRMQPEKYGDYRKVAFIQGRPNQNPTSEEPVIVTIYAPSKTYIEELKKYISSSYNVTEFIYKPNLY